MCKEESSSSRSFWHIFQNKPFFVAICYIDEEPEIKSQLKQAPLTYRRKKSVFQYSSSHYFKQCRKEGGQLLIIFWCFPIWCFSINYSVNTKVTCQEFLKVCSFIMEQMHFSAVVTSVRSSSHLEFEFHRVWTWNFTKYFFSDSTVFQFQGNTKCRVWWAWDFEGKIHRVFE